MTIPYQLYVFIEEICVSVFQVIYQMVYTLRWGLERPPDAYRT